MSDNHLFTETEKIIGHITVSSGSLMITDGIWDSPQIHPNDKQILDLDEEKTLRIPVLTTILNNHRIILIDIDSATEVPLEEDLVEMLPEGHE